MFEQYIFGYGSLICPHSRAVTAPSVASRVATPVKVKHLQRLWSCRVPTQIHGRGWTAMGVKLQTNAVCYGVLLPVNNPELEHFDVRELGYTRHLIPDEDVEPIDILKNEADYNNEQSYFEVKRRQTGNLPKIWVYIQEEQNTISPEHPIPQTYVDIMLRGCLSISPKFAQEFLLTTEGWKSSENENNEDVHWVNDRHDPLYPRADIHYSRSQGANLDQLLTQHRPHEISKRKPFYGRSQTA